MLLHLIFEYFKDFLKSLSKQTVFFIQYIKLLLKMVALLTWQWWLTLTNKSWGLKLIALWKYLLNAQWNSANGRKCQKMENERENFIVALCPSVKPYGILLPWSALAFHLKKSIMEMEKSPRKGTSYRRHCWRRDTELDGPLIWPATCYQSQMYFIFSVLSIKSNFI